MNTLDNFMKILTGDFDNREQIEELAKEGITDFPFSKHKNTICNDKIKNLPADFDGFFMVEESHYAMSGKENGLANLFLFTQEGDDVKLTSYEIPAGYEKNSFTYDKMGEVEFEELKPSAKFTPAVYTLKDGVWEGGSVSMFSPVLKFTLFERFSPEFLEVSESMEVNGRRTFGFDRPIIYKRTDR